jgi:blue copper oxidase
MKRRVFLTRALAASCGYGLLSSCTDELVTPVSNSNPAVKAAGKVSTTRNALKIPSVASPNGLSLQSGLTTSDLGGGKISKVWAYNGQFPGPTLKANSGSMVMITLDNQLPEETITHWHGMVVDPHNDGQPHHVIPFGATYDYHYTINQRAALNWYHPHPHMRTGKQVYFGMAGAFIVTDAYEESLGLPSGTYEVPLIVRDATLDSYGNLDYKPRSGGFLGQFPMANGTIDPYLNVDKTVYRFRVLNGANSRIFNLTLSNGAAFTLIGNDGGLLESSTNLTSIDMSNGERTDILVDFSGYAPGTKIMLKDIRSGWNLLEFRVTSNAVTYTGPRSTTSTINKLTNPVTTRVFSFDGMTKINGKEFDMNRIDFKVPFGQTELWRFTTSGNAPHPVHVHGASFQVVSRSGGRNKLFAWESGWKDTVLLEDRETVEVLIRFDSYKGQYVMHCHKLEHEDIGMMSSFEVI